MLLNDEDVAFVYARACQAWYGAKAPKVVADQIKKLRKRGDESGVEAWTRVASKLPHVHHKSRHRESGKLY